MLLTIASTVVDEGIINVSDPAAVSWAGLGALAIVGFLLRAFDGVAWIHNHPLPASLIVSVVGAFIFGANVLTEWRTLLAQGIMVAAGAVGVNSVGKRAEANAAVKRSDGSARLPIAVFVLLLVLAMMAVAWLIGKAAAGFFGGAIPW
jgi:hypothetical protein